MLIKTSQDTEERPRQSHRSIVIYISRLLWGRNLMKVDNPISIWDKHPVRKKSEFVLTCLRSAHTLRERCISKVTGVDTCQEKPRSATNIHLNWTSCAQAQVPIRSAAEVNIAIIFRTLSCACDIKLCMWNGILHEQQVLLQEFLWSSQLYRRMSKSGKVWKLSFNAAVAHHVSIVCVTRARYWEFAWELHSELCWVLPSDESTDSLHSWILPYKNCNADEIID